MCFGMTDTKQQTTQSTPSPAVANAATGNLDFVKNLQSSGFSPYTGQQVANFAPQQQSSFDMTAGIANNNTAPQAGNLINSFSSAPASSVSASPISSAMSPYMNQYVMQALAPTLQQMNIADAATNQATDAQATGSGAFGDARTGIQQANNSFNQNVEREGVIGNAYNNAFNTAIGAGAQDVSNNLNAQTTNANLSEAKLGRQLTGAQALEGLQNQQLGVAGAQNQMGQQQTAQQQAQLTAAYNQWLMAQQYPFQTASLMNQTTAAGAQAMPATTTATTAQPNNSGWALGGAALGGLFGNSGLGSAMGLAMFSDRDLKDDIKEIGELRDGTPVYSYRYFDEPENVSRIGLMAQDVEKRRPDAVKEAWPGGAKMVDYGKATELSRALGLAA
jgi:hypothetical protein